MLCSLLLLVASHVPADHAPLPPTNHHHTHTHTHTLPPLLQLAGSEEAETWAFLQTHFAADGRRFLLERLGFGEVLPAVPGAEGGAAEGGAEGEASLAGGDAAALDAAGEGMAQLALEQHQQQQQALAEQLLDGDGADFFEQSPVTGERPRCSKAVWQRSGGEGSGAALNAAHTAPHGGGHPCCAAVRAARRCPQSAGGTAHSRRHCCCVRDPVIL